MTPDRFHDDGTHLFELADAVDVRCPSCRGHATTRARTPGTPARVTCTGCAFSADEEGGWLGPERGLARKRCGRCQQLVERWVPGPRHPHAVPLVCACGFRFDAVVSWQHAPTGPHDPTFGLDLWLVEPACGQVLWAYNAAHLALLREYVAADLRERMPNRNASVVSRLPQWIKDQRNRDDVLRAIARLQQRLTEPI